MPRVAILTLSAWTATGSSLQAADAIADADGIVAEIRMAADGLKLDWRFQRPPPDPVESASVSADGQPLAEPDGPVAAFPAPGQTAVIEILSERDDPNAPRFSAADLASALPAGVTMRRAFYEASLDGSRLTGLVAGIDRSLDDLGAETADRRALLITAEGMDLASGPLLGAAARARRRDIPVLVVLSGTASDADRRAAARFAQEARGTLLDGGGDRAAQIAYTALSGAELSFPFQVRPYLPWQSRTVVIGASIAYGGRSLDLSATVERPPAGYGQAAAAAWNATRPSLPGFFAGLGLAGLVGSAVRARAILVRGGRT